MIAVAPPVQSIRDLDLPKYVVRYLEHRDIKTIQQLTSSTREELLAMRGFGYVRLHEVRRALGKHGLGLKGDSRPG